MHIVKIADLNNYDRGVHNLSIKVAVSIKSKQHDNEEFNYFYMDLRDDTGEICAVAYNEASTRLHNFMKPNQIYVITQFYIGYSDRRYTSVPHERKIVLVEDTAVHFSGQAAMIEWPSVFRRRKRVFYNIVAVCTGVAETTRSDSGKLTRKVMLLDESYNTIILHVWNRETVMFDRVNCESYPVLFVKDARIYRSHEDEDQFVVTTTRYLQFLDSNEPRARCVRDAVQNAELEQNSQCDDSSDSSDSSDDYYDDDSSF